MIFVWEDWPKRFVCVEPQKSNASKASVKCFSVRTVNLVNQELNSLKEILSPLKGVFAVLLSFRKMEHELMLLAQGHQTPPPAAFSPSVYFCLFQASPANRQSSYGFISSYIIVIFLGGARLIIASANLFWLS